MHVHRCFIVYLLYALCVCTCHIEVFVLHIFSSCIVPNEVTGLDLTCELAQRDLELRYICTAEWNVSV